MKIAALLVVAICLPMFLSTSCLLEPDQKFVTDTLTVTKSVHDTVTVTKTVHDTIIKHDTIRVSVYIHDTLWKHDTLRIHDTSYIYRDTLRIHDTIRIINTIHDTVTVHDTIRSIITLHDTLWRHDTLRIHDTTRVHDTLWRYDTLRIHDTTKVHDTLWRHDTLRTFATTTLSTDLAGVWNGTVANKAVTISIVQETGAWDFSYTGNIGADNYYGKIETFTNNIAKCVYMYGPGMIGENANWTISISNNVMTLQQTGYPMFPTMQAFTLNRIQ